MQGLREIKPRRNENLNDPNNLINDVEDNTTEASWNKNGRAFVRQVNQSRLKFCRCRRSELLQGEDRWQLLIIHQAA